MVIRNKEEHSTAIWRFVAVALLPLLLLFWAGFTLGNTTGKEKGNLKKLLQEETAKLAACQEASDKHLAFFREGDKILDGLETKIDEFSKSLRAIVPLNDLSAMSDWENEVFKFFKTVDRDLSELEVNFVFRNEKDSVLLVGLKYLKEYKRLNKLRLDIDKMNQTANMEQGIKDKLTEMEEDLRNRNKEEQEKLKAEREQLNNDRMQEKLAACQEKLEKCISSKAEAGTISHAAQAAAIKAEVGKIRNEIIPNLRTTFIGNDQKRIDVLKDKLRGSLETMESELKTIK